MKLSHGTSFALIAAFVASASFASQPPDVVTSDSAQNTAAGTDALLDVYGLYTIHGGIKFYDGGGNTALGYQALQVDTGGNDNTALGNEALAANVATDNTAVGSYALSANTAGANNTAAGYDALSSNTTGGGNTSVGSQTLGQNSSGQDNSAFGAFALDSSATGSGNTAVGFAALAGPGVFGETGSNNTAVGYGALEAASSGSYNTAVGQNALNANTAANYNVAVGVGAQFLNVSGGSNTAIGQSALQTNTAGSNNIGIGFHGGFYTSGSDNIDIASPGVAGESDVIRIGVPSTQRETFIAGVYGTPLTGSAVVVNSAGQLGVIVSSERFKTDIAPLGSEMSRLSQLRPVTFHLKTDPQGPLQYGLIAEEVAKVYPELVIRNETGRIDGVRYDEAAPMLLQEVQHQNARIDQLEKEISDMKSLEQKLTAAMLKEQDVPERLASR